MFTTVKHFFEGLIHLWLKDAPEVEKNPQATGIVFAKNGLNNCCKDEIQSCLNNDEYKDIIKNSSNTIAIDTNCSKCGSRLYIQVKGKKQ